VANVDVDLVSELELNVSFLQTSSALAKRESDKTSFLIKHCCDSNGRVDAMTDGGVPSE
jgi:hypothetical protein